MYNRVVVLAFLMLVGDSVFAGFCEKLCTNNSITSLEQYQEEKSGILDKVWTLGLTNWGPTANLLKVELQNLRHSDEEKVRYFAESTMNFLSGLNPHMQNEVSGCAQAKMIEASIACHTCGDGTKIVDAINNYMDNLYGHIVNLAYYNSLKTSGCPMCEEDERFSELPSFECPADGLEYDFKTIWDLRGGFLPCSFRDLVWQLYNSDDFLDRYIAATVTYKLTDFSERMFLAFDRFTTIELIAAQVDIFYDPECCDNKRNYLEYLRDDVTAQRKAGITALTEFYSSGGCDK